MRQSSLAFLLGLASILSLTYAQNQTKCRAIALQGGGDRGAYEAGVLYGLVMNAPNPIDFQYDVVTGVSAGSINALGVMIYEKGEEVEMVEFLNQSWLATGQRDVFAEWPLGYFQGMFFEPSLVNNDPELSYLRSQIFLPPNARKAVLVTTDVNTAAKVAFTEQDWESDSDFAGHVALFSSAIPFLFKYRQYGNFTFIDGGWSEGVDIEDAVLRCREIVSDDSDIIIDVIYCANTSLNLANTHKFNGLQMYFRGQDIANWRKATYLFNFTKESFDQVDFRYFIIPSHVLPDETVPLSFNTTRMEVMMQYGIQDAIDAINQGEGVTADKMLQFSKDYVNNVFHNRQTPAYAQSYAENN